MMRGATKREGWGASDVLIPQKGVSNKNVVGTVNVDIFAQYIELSRISHMGLGA